MRWRGVLALLAVAALAAGGAALGSVNARPLGSASPTSATAGSWFCPHGGGPGWRGELSIVNPGPDPVRARVSALAARQPRPARTITVPAESDIRVPVDASRRESSTKVEYFGGWIGVGWISIAHGDEEGIAAEPCLPALARTWLMPDGTTVRGEDGWVVAMNPTSSDAIFGIRLLTEGAETVPGPWSDYVLRPGHSAAFQLGQFKLGKRTVAAVLEAKIGRVAAATIGVSSRGGIRAAGGTPFPQHHLTLPGGPDAGRSEVVVADAGGGPATYGGTVLRSDGSQNLGAVGHETLPPDQARTYDVSTTKASTFRLDVTSKTGVAAVRRTFGPLGDQGSITAAAPASAWVVQSGTVFSAGSWRLSLANPGTTPASVSLWLLTDTGRVRSLAPVDVRIPAGRTVVMGVSFTDRATTGAVVAVASSGTFVPLATSFTSNRAGFSTAVGEAIPARWVPKVG